ncbi:MAG: hypothetical protein JWN04_3176, partial [Myxococcaceae bacterium]|nr:hypothetical protein [Myxococcaceae bacterium]
MPIELRSEPVHRPRPQSRKQETCSALVAARLTLLCWLLLTTSCSGAAGAERSSSRHQGQVARLDAGPAATKVVPRAPAILFVVPNGRATIDLTYLSELTTRGFEVDYTDNLQELSEQRLQPFNVVVLMTSPEAYATRGSTLPASAERVDTFVQVVEHYLQDGGGVLLMSGETSDGRPPLAELGDRWGVSTWSERIRESDANRLGNVPHMPYGGRLAYSDAISRSALTAGVRGVWYPTDQAFAGAMTMPLAVNRDWDVVLRGSKTSTSEGLDVSALHLSRSMMRQRAQGEVAPPLFAVRKLFAGRVAAIAQWSQFSIGAGTKWLYDRVVLERGLASTPSDFGRLLENTYRWLAEPSLSAGDAPGGFRTDHAKLRFAPPSAETAAQFSAPMIDYDVNALSASAGPTGRRVYRGIIGAQTRASLRVEDAEAYARAARKSGLDFVVLLERIESLDADQLKALSATCKRLSGPDLLMLAGFSAVTNLGNRHFFFGLDPDWP